MLTYRELAAATGWSHGSIGEYLTGRVLPTTDRFDALIRLLGATAAEQGALATARDRVEDGRRDTAVRPMVQPVAVPRQLPLDAYGFAGRDAELAELDAMLGLAAVNGARRRSVRRVADQKPGPGTPVTVVAVTGMPGVGKTALAVHWAHRVAAAFPDGQIYVELRGYGPQPPVPPHEALAGMLRALGVDPSEIPADLAERAARYRTALADRRILLVLDNASGPEQVRPLLPGTRSCFVVTTSRRSMAGLVAREGAARMRLTTLAPAESLSVLERLIGARAEATPTAAAALADACAGLPLALRIAAEYATANPSIGLGELVAALRQERQGLAVLAASGDPHTAVRSVFSWSYRQLAPPTARAFGLLGLHPGRQVDAHAAAALLGTPVAEARAQTQELARAHLLDEVSAGRYRMHDLLRAYAVERATAEINPSVRRAALTRLLDHYLHTAASAMDTLYPHERYSRPELGPCHTVTAPVAVASLASGWLDTERTNLVDLARYAATHGWDRHSVDLSCVLWRYFEVGGHYQEALAVHGSAAAVADGYRHRAVLTNLGSVHWWLGNYRDAKAYLEQSLYDDEDRYGPADRARVLARLGLVQERLGEYREALANLTEAGRLYRAAGNHHGEAAQLLNLGALHRRLGDYETAAGHQMLAAERFMQVGDRRLAGYAQGNLGVAYSLLGRHAEAARALHAALDCCRAAGDRGGEGSALSALGQAHRRQQRHPEALEYLHSALGISRETGDRSLETETLNALGEVLSAMGQPESAAQRHASALALAEASGDRYEQARALEGMGYAQYATGNGTSASTHWRQALDFYTALEVPDAQRVSEQISMPPRSV